jgi:hypothetical protein
MNAKAVHDTGHTMRRWQEPMPNILGVPWERETHYLVRTTFVE